MTTLNEAGDITLLWRTEYILIMNRGMVVDVGELRKVARVLQADGSYKVDMELLGFITHFLRQLPNAALTTYVIENIHRPMSAKELSAQFMVDESIAEAHLLDLSLHGLLKAVPGEKYTLFELTSLQPWRDLALRFARQLQREC